MNNKLILIVATLLLSSGCASLSKEECRHADWQLIGMEDGSRGYGLERLGEHRKACARIGVTPDLAAYEAGHTQGVSRYCTPLRGYALGTSGASYREICPSALAEAFRRGYNDGRELHALRTRADRLGVAVANTQQQIVVVEARVVDLEQHIVSDTSTPASRRQALEQLGAARAEFDLLHDQLFAAEYEKSLVLEDYEALRNYHRQLGY